MPPASRRTLLQAGAFGVGAAALGLLTWSRRQTRNSSQSSLGKMPELMGPLAGVPDEITGIPLLRLPPGFRYRTISWAGETLHDGNAVPGSADGMGVVASRDGRITLVRNHELRGSSGPIGSPGLAYDVTGGGTTTLVFDTVTESLADSWVSLCGTLNNCAGGVTPWGTWLSCEEAPWSPALTHLPVPARQALWDMGRAKREHGFVFEVPATGTAEPEPIRAMGQFYHEAVAIDPRDGVAYMTEDLSPRAGFYRFVPDQPGDLAAGGRLQMMRVGDGRDMRVGLDLGAALAVQWVDIPDPEAGFSAQSSAGDGVVTQGLAAGGSAFIALEGCVYDRGEVYFTSKSGGQAGAGSVYVYDPGQQAVRMVYESPGSDVFSGPDNIIMSPRGSLLICEDRVSGNPAGQYLAGLRSDGTLFQFCQINPDLGVRHGGHDLGTSARNSEWAGATFSPDGEWLFCNVYAPGFTVAITGPWEDGLI